ncbi:calcium/sodium antiporter [Kangiella sp. HZ709]|uniref:calcium/sodium antiporter n=1 Tax=Kangiella sp. HZ709 TaxID=2666328 RepID=UPI0012B0CA4F|nr:calcium/sodium antiporter [Kangiella sp. HZ709]MRX27466.1 calcium/sodium antiporter [Kangiella sp. HZ709]
MLEYLAYLLVGISLLVWSADRFTDGAAAIAQNFGVSRLIVGLTIVAIGSSSPEIFVSLMDSIKSCEPGELNCGPKLAIGNAIGSNIANVAMVLGITAIVRPLLVDSSTLRREIPILFGVTIMALVFLWNLKLSHLEGAILLTSLLIYFIWLVRLGLKSRVKDDPMLEEIVEELPDRMGNGKAIFYLVIGLVLLVFSSNILIKGASGIALHFGVSETVIGLTIVALGTSLPELAASIAGVLKEEYEIAIGNVIGSNIFNLLAVLGIPALIAAPSIEEKIITFDYPVMFCLTVAMAVMAYGFKGPGKITRLEGIILLGVFIGYYAVRFF